MEQLQSSKFTICSPSTGKGENINPSPNALFGPRDLAFIVMLANSGVYSAVSLLYPRVVFNPQPLSTVPGQIEHFSEFMRSCHWITGFQWEKYRYRDREQLGFGAEASSVLESFCGWLGSCCPGRTQMLIKGRAITSVGEDAVASPSLGLMVIPLVVTLQMV